MAITWQKAALMLTVILLGTGVITYSNLFATLFQLSGVEYTDYGDIHNATHMATARFDVNTSYWRFEFAHYNGTKYENETLFKKQTRSRTLHINLDRIESLVTVREVKEDGTYSVPTNVRVAWHVATYGGKTRPIKDGDSWERGKVNKNYLIFTNKYPYQDLKWSFAVEGHVDIDPFIFGVKPFKDCVYKTVTDVSYVNHYKNITTCNNVTTYTNKAICKYPVNKTLCPIVKEVCYDETVLDYVETIEKPRQECIEDSTRIKYAETIFDYKKENKACSVYPDRIVCDDTSIADGNGDGICQAGETCYVYELTDKIELKSKYNGMVKVK